MRVIDYVAPPKVDHWWTAKPRPALRALELPPPNNPTTMANPVTSYFTPGRGTITEPFYGGTRLAPQLALITQDEQDMITAALSGSGRLAIEMRIIGLVAAAMFPAQAHPHLLQPHQCYMVMLPDPGAPTDDSRNGNSILHIPTNHVSVDPQRFPQTGATATAAAAAPTILATPTPFVAEDKFVANITEPKTWAREIKRLLVMNKYAGVDEEERVQQVLDNVEENTALGLVSIHGARDLSADAVLALITQLYPLKASGVLRQHDLRSRKATNDEAVTTFVNKLLSDWIQSYGVATLDQALTGLDSAAIKVWVQTAAALLVYSLPARHQAAATSSATAWVSAVETKTDLLALMVTLCDLDAAALQFSKKARPQSSGVYVAAPASPRDKELETLIAKIAELEAAGQRNRRAPIDFSKPWQAKFGLCNTCKDDPQSTTGQGPREHWRKDCPSR